MLKLEHMDLLMVHEPERPGRYDLWAKHRDYTGPVIDVLDDRRRGVSFASPASAAPPPSPWRR